MRITKVFPDDPFKTIEQHIVLKETHVSRSIDCAIDNNIIQGHRFRNFVTEAACHFARVPGSDLDPMG